MRNGNPAVSRLVAILRTLVASVFSMLAASTTADYLLGRTQVLSGVFPGNFATNNLLFQFLVFFTPGITMGIVFTCFMPGKAPLMPCYLTGAFTCAAAILGWRYIMRIIVEGNIGDSIFVMTSLILPTAGTYLGSRLVLSLYRWLHKVKMQ